MADDDAELFDAWCAGDRHAGTQLFRRHFDGIYGFFVHKVGADAHELTQRTFAACIETRERFRRDAPFRGYLYGIARIQLLRHVQARVGKNTIDPDEVALSDTGVSPSKAIALLEHQELLLAAMRRIPVDFQITLELFYWNGLTIPEVAAALDIAPGTVKSRLSRAKALVKAELKALHRGDAPLDDAALEVETLALKKALGL